MQCYLLSYKLQRLFAKIIIKKSTVRIEIVVCHFINKKINCQLFISDKSNL